MEINITKFFNDADPSDFSASRHERGENVGKETWNAAMEAVDEHMLLDTPAKVEALRDHAKGFGAWEKDEIDAWTPQACNALLLQMIAGDIREVPDMDPIDWDWDLYEEMCQEGTCSGRMGRGDDDQVYYDLGD